MSKVLNIYEENNCNFLLKIALKKFVLEFKSKKPTRITKASFVGVFTRLCFVSTKL